MMHQTYSKSYGTPDAVLRDLPDLEVLSNDTLVTPPAWSNSEDELDQIGEQLSSDDLWNYEEPERRRSSGVAVQNLLSQIDGRLSVNLDTSLSAATMMDTPFDSSRSWKVVIETSFAPKYFRNDRKNVQCFPACTYGNQPSTDGGISGHGTSTTWCRGPISARAFAVDPETNIADIAMFQAFGAFIMHNDEPRVKPLSEVGDTVRANIRRIDGKSFEIRLAPTVWKYSPPLTKKKSENRNQCFFVIAIFFQGREIGRAVSPPFDMASQKAEVRKKRALASDESTSWTKQLVLDSFAQASNWAYATMGYGSPSASNSNKKSAAKGEEAAEEKEESVDSIEVSDSQPSTHKKISSKDQQFPSPMKSSNTRSYPQIPGRNAGSENALSKQGLDVGFFHHHQDDLERADPIMTASVVMPPKQTHFKRISMALLLWLPPFGFLGAHHAYLGRETYALTSAVTLNMLLLGWIMDAVRIPMLIFSVNFPSVSSKSSMDFFTLAEYFLLWLLFGLLGGHRYLIGDYKLGLFFTLTLGGLGTLYIWDGFHLSTLLDKGIARRQSSLNAT